MEKARLRINAMLYGMRFKKGEELIYLNGYFQIANPLRELLIGDVIENKEIFEIIEEKTVEQRANDLGFKKGDKCWWKEKYIGEIIEFIGHLTEDSIYLRTNLSTYKICGSVTNKIAIHCPTKEDFEFIKSLFPSNIAEWKYIKEYELPLVFAINYGIFLPKRDCTEFLFITIEDYCKSQNMKPVVVTTDNVNIYNGYQQVWYINSATLKTVLYGSCEAWKLQSPHNLDNDTKVFNTEQAAKDYLKSQLKANTGKFKVGDRVKVVRKAENNEGDWGQSWVSTMDSYVGKEYIIDSVHSKDGYCLVDRYNFIFPEFVLEKVKEDKSKTIEVEIPEGYKCIRDPYLFVDGTGQTGMFVEIKKQQFAKSCKTCLFELHSKEYKQSYCYDCRAVSNYPKWQSKQNLSNTKIWIGDNPRLSELVQKKAFELGWSWSSGDTEVLYKNITIGLYLWEDKTITFTNEHELFNEYYSYFTEITPQDLGISRQKYEELLTTEDGVKLYKGDSPYYVFNGKVDILGEPLNDKSDVRKECKYFSTKAKAEEYVQDSVNVKKLDACIDAMKSLTSKEIKGNIGENIFNSLLRYKGFSFSNNEGQFCTYLGINFVKMRNNVHNVDIIDLYEVANPNTYRVIKY